TGQRTEVGVKTAPLVQRGDGRQTVGFPPLEVDLSAPRCGVNDPRALGVGDVGLARFALPAIDDLVGMHRSDGGCPLLRANNTSDLGRVAVFGLLGRQVVEGAVVLPA